ncbi:hypothetical protein L0156_03735 [bacterium]|nr:hypothetical protein [bacterium]
MNQISEQELRDAIIATKKDVKLVGAAKNDRINSVESLYKEFSKLPVDRQREIIASVAMDYFVGAQYKIAFQLNSLPAAALADGTAAAGKALFFTREEECLKETIRALRLYLQSPFYKIVASSLGEAAEIVRSDLAAVARILTEPDVYGLIQSFDPSTPVSERLIQCIARVAMYTRDLDSSLLVAKFLHARRHSSAAETIAGLIENAIFMARDRRSVREILAGLGGGGVDRVLQRHAENKAVLSNIRDVASKTRDSRAIRSYLDAL